MADSPTASPRVRLLSITLVTLVVLSPLVAPLGVGPIGTAAANTGVHYVTDSGFEIEDTSGGAVPRSGNPYPDADTLELPGITLSASGNAYVTLAQRNGTFTNLTNVDDDPSILVTPDDKQEVALMGGFDSLNFSDADYASADSDADIVYSASSTATLRLESTGLSTGTTVNAVDVDSDSTLDSASVSSNGSVTFSSLDSGTHVVNLKTTAPSISSFSVTNPSGQDVTVSFDSDKQLSTISATVSGAESATLTESDFAESGSGPYSYEATYSGSSDGTYDVTLDTATDGAGNDGASGESDSATVDTYTPDPADFEVDVSAPTTAIAGDQASVNATIDNTGDRSDTQTITFSVDGAERDSQTVSLDGSESELVAFPYSTTGGDVGDRALTVASDDDSDAATLTVNDPAPSADAGTNMTVHANTSVAFDGTNSTDNLGVTTYQWDFADGMTSDGPSPTHTFAAPGTYTVELTVTDQSNNTDTDTVTVSVTETTAPIADAGNSDTVGDEDTPVAFDATASTDNDAIASYEWDWTGDGTYEGTGAIANHTYSQPGDYTVVLRVTDAAGNTDTDTLNVTIADVTAPTAVVQSDVTTNVSVVTFSGNESTDNVGVVSYEWDFDDGTVATGPTSTHTFADGTYAVALTVTDAAGNTATTTRNVTVDTTAPAVQSFEATNLRAATVSLSVETDERLSTLAVALDGPTTATLDTSAFTETATNGTWTYTATHTGEAGTYTATLQTATDALGNDGADGELAQVTVGPTIHPGSVTVERTPEDNLTVAFDSDSNLTEIGVAISGPETATLDETAFTKRLTPEGTYTYSAVYETTEAGIYTATITRAVDVEAVDGASGQADTTGLNARPLASSYRFSVDANVTLSATETEVPPELDPTYEWDLDDDGTYERTGETVDISFETAGKKTVTLRVADNESQSTDAMTLTVTDSQPPTLNLTATVDDEPTAVTDTLTLSTGGVVSYSANESTDNAGIVAYEWDLDGDGAVDATGATAAFTYTDAGTVPATVTVRDASGNEATRQWTVDATAPEVGEVGTNLSFEETATEATTVQTLSITNNGTAPLTLDSISLSGPDADAYTVEQATNIPISVPAGGTVDLGVQFTPTSAGPHSATLELTTDDSTAETLSVELSGSGGDSAISVRASTKQFGTVEIGDTQTTTVTVTNDGAAPGEVTAVRLTGPGASQYTVTDADGLPAQLAAGERRTVSVAFDPATTGRHRASLVVETADVSTGVSLQGTGSGPDIRLPTRSTSFGEIGKDGTTTRTVPIENTGQQSLTVEDVSVTGDDAGSFSVQDAPDSVAAGSTATATVAYDPTGTGDDSATLAVESDDPDEPTATARLDGSAVGATVGVDRETLNFGNVTRGDTVTLNVTIENLATAAANLTIESVSLTGRDDGAFSVAENARSGTLAPGETREIEVSFNPTSRGTKQAQMVVLSDAENSPQLTIWLSNDETYVVVQQVSANRTDNETTVNVDANNVQSGERLNVNVSQPGTREQRVGFDNVSMTVRDTTDFGINITHAREPPTPSSAEYTPADGRQSLQYVQLTHSVAADTTYDDTVVSYRVNKSRIPADTDPANITLHRWNGTAWNFTTNGELVRETPNSYVYRVETPGFSQFAISGPDQQPQTGDNTTADNETGAGGTNGTNQSSTATPTITPGDEKTVTPTDDSDGNSLLLLVGSLVVLGLLLVALLWWRRDESETKPAKQE